MDFRTSTIGIAIIVAGCSENPTPAGSSETGSSDTSVGPDSTTLTSTSTTDATASSSTTTQGSESSTASESSDDGPQTSSGSSSGSGESTTTSGESSSGSSSDESTTGPLDCGDGVIDAGEECDDSNLENDDGCDADCVPSGVVFVGTGLDHTCVLTRAGGVRCWGEGQTGQLGYANTNDIGRDETPALFGNVDVGGVAIGLTVGTHATCALLEGGNVRCWGLGSGGALGYGNPEDIGDDETPATAGDVPTGGIVAEVSASEGQTCIVRADGAARCWGQGFYGALGYGNEQTFGATGAADLFGDIEVGGDVVHLSAGYSHTCAIMDTNGARCWGRASDGQLGYGNTENIGDNETPDSVGEIDIGADVEQISAGAFHTCAVLEGGALKCWGANFVGQLGYGNTDGVGTNEVPSSLDDVDVGGTVIQVSAGVIHTCALLEGGTVRCWGQGSVLGYGNTIDIGDDETPASAGDVDIGGVVVQVSVGVSHACAVLDDGALRCWGEGAWGALGYGTTLPIGDNETPASAGDVQVFPP